MRGVKPSFEMAAVLPDMVAIPAGVYVMGTESGRDDEAPPHEVRLDGFLIGRCAVTNREYRSYVQAASAPAPEVWSNPAFSHPDQPVVEVSWFDAVAYCEWISQMTGNAYRLPTEAEREYACRAGTETSFPWGDDAERELGDYGRRWYEGAPELVGGPVNGFSLCNMADNVHEWCSDWYLNDYYRCSPRFNPTGPAAGDRRSSRGGSWRHAVKVTRSTARSALNPGYRYTDYGFRLALTPQPR